MDLDLLDNLPPPTISLASTRSWSMSKFIDFPEDLPGDEEDHRRPQIDGYRHSGESRYLPMGPVSRGILIQGSGEYVHPQDVWASSFSKRYGSTDSHYYPISTDSMSNAGTTPSPTSTTGHTFLSGDGHGTIGSSLDSGPSSITSPNSDGSDSSGHSVSSTSEGHQTDLSRLSVPSFGSSVHAQSGSHSPISIYSSSPSPLALSATSSPQAPYLSVPDRMLSPLQLPQQDSGPIVNIPDIYSHSSTFDLHTQDVYNLTLSQSFTEFDQHRLQHYSPPLHASTSYEAELESEFGYRSPFRAIDADLEQALGKRTRVSADFVDHSSDRKRARPNSYVAAASTMENKRRGKPRKSEPALSSQAATSPPTTFIDSDDEFHQGGGEDDSDSDVYVPSDEEGGTRSTRGGIGRKASGSGSGNAETLRELELRANAAQELSIPGVFEHSGFTGADGAQGSAVLRRQNGRRTLPVPVPNVTKKSRGRKVPVSGEDAEPSSPLVYHPFDFGGADVNFGVDTVAPRGRPVKTFTQDTQTYVQPEHLAVGSNEPFKVVSGGIKKLSGERRYVCTVDGCGKCFVRGEHLKRHVRSLHTWDKPHKCPHPGCGKSFSRRDNLGQHVRVHL